MGAEAYQSSLGFQANLPAKVLILDDDSFDRKRLRRWVERADPAGVQLSEAICLNSFAGHLRQESFDLIIIDFGLSDGTGLDALDLLRICEKNAASFTVMVSGSESDGMRDACLLQGCDAFVTKSDLNQSVMATLLRQSKDADLLEPQIPPRSEGQTALDYWGARASRRARRDKNFGRTENHIVLSQALGADLSAVSMPIAPAHQDMRDEKLNAKMSANLRSFIEDFLSSETYFEFEQEPKADEPPGGTDA